MRSLGTFVAADWLNERCLGGGAKTEDEEDDEELSFS